MNANEKRQHIARSNLQHCFPEKDQTEVEELLEGVAIETGKWLLETPYVWFKPAPYLTQRIEVKNADLLKRAYEQAKGAVLILPHFGNWEVVNFYVPQRYPFGAIYKPAKRPWLEKLIFAQRSRVGTQMFSANTKGIRQALKFLKKGNVIAVLPDQLPSAKAGVYAPFFKQQAYTSKIAHTLIKHNKSEAVLTTVLRKPQGKGFIIEFNTLDNIHSDDPTVTATHINQAIEQGIMKAPEQYQWVYPRFKKQPEGTPTIYSKHQKQSIHVA